MSTTQKPTATEAVKILHKALKSAQAHLEYCGYGDRWERECATEAKLPKEIEEALEQTSGCLNS